MLARRKRRSPTWQQALFLLIFGVVIGYPSCASIDIWGGRSPSRFDDLYKLGAFAGVVCFISGVVSFLAIAVKVVTSPPVSRPDVAAPPPFRASTGASSRAAPPPSPRDAGFKRQARAPSDAKTALAGLQITIVAVVALAALIVLPRGLPPTESFWRAYWLSAVFTFALSQLPYAVAFIRTWKVPDRTGLALAMVAGAAQVLGRSGFLFYADLRHIRVWNYWPRLSASLGLAVVVFAYLAWRSSPLRKGDVSLMISVVSGFVSYTALAQIALAILYARVGVRGIDWHLPGFVALVSGSVSLLAIATKRGWPR